MFGIDLPEAMSGDHFGHMHQSVPLEGGEVTFLQAADASQDIVDELPLLAAWKAIKQFDSTRQG